MKVKIVASDVFFFLAYAMLWQCSFYGNCTFQTCKRIEKSFHRDLSSLHPYSSQKVPDTLLRALKALRTKPIKSKSTA